MTTGLALANRISFGPPGPGTGSVTIKGDKLQVLFDGRSFGETPVTIHDVPKGDYVVEATTADGRHLARPVSVEESAEATVDFGGGSSAEGDRAGGSHEGTFRLPLTSKVLLGVGGGGLAVGAVFGVLEMRAHGQYESAGNQAALDGLSRSGNRDALIANIGFVTCGASLVAAGLVALPAFLRSEHPVAVPSAVVATTGSHVLAIASVSTTF